jgi:hypothetical protein
MRMRAIIRGAAALAMGGSLFGIGLPAASATASAASATASAASATASGPVTVTISAKSRARYFGATLVGYRDRGYTMATISGDITGGSASEQATLLAQPFPFVSPFAAQGSPVSISGSPQRYSFPVHPVIATRYEVQVTKASDAGQVLGSSAVQTVYVTLQPLLGAGSSKQCTRPVCHLTYHIVVKVPPLSYSTESAKRWYPYFAISFSTVGTPAAPKYVTLDRSATVSAAKRLGSTEYEVTVRYVYNVGPTRGFHWAWDMCDRDLYLTDGIGLPGHHGCGDQRLPVVFKYLG